MLQEGGVNGNQWKTAELWLQTFLHIYHLDAMIITGVTPPGSFLRVNGQRFAFRANILDLDKAFQLPFG